MVCHVYVTHILMIVQNLVSIPWILVLYKKRKRIAEANSFLLLVIVCVVAQIVREDEECYGGSP